MSLLCHKELDVWKAAMELVEFVYRITRVLPREERFGITSQMRRASVSIPANIAEGYARSHRREYLHYLSIAMGSVQEVDTLLEIVRRLQLSPGAQVEQVTERSAAVGRMLRRLIQSLQFAAPPRPKTPHPTP